MSESTPSAEDHDALSEIAKKRRAQLEALAPSKPPSVIESVESSEVVYTLDLRAMPFGQADLALLNRRMLELYNLTLDTLDLSPLLKSMSPQQISAVPDDELLRLLVRTRDATLRWTRGRYPSRNDFVEITSITCNVESILVSVRGQSQVAENIAKEVLEAWWEAAGVQRSFDQLASGLLLTGYATTTRLNLGRPVESMLDPAIFKYLNENLVGGEGLAASLGRNPTDRANREMVARVFLDDLSLRISVFDVSSGQSSLHELSFNVMRNSDYGQGYMNVSSGLPYEQHEKLVAGLFAPSK